jgi:hypothetical protein
VETNHSAGHRYCRRDQQYHIAHDHEDLPPLGFMEGLREEWAIIAMEGLGKEQVSLQEELNELQAQQPVDSVRFLKAQVKYDAIRLAL